MTVDNKMHSPKQQPNVPYAIHSVGKVFTGVLMLKLIEKGIISKESIDQPIKDHISETVWKQLPEKVKIHLEENGITLRQVMTHRGGLGDYLPDYTNAIAEENIPKINQPEDFIPYIDNFGDKEAINKDVYSNVGILLVGLAIKHACKDQDYNKILEEHLLDDVGITCLPHKPDNGVYNLGDKIAPHIVGGPSGGYWMTVEDLAKFGKWLYEEYKKPEFEKIMREYGKEFYYPEYGKIAHDGRIPSANAHFAIYLETGIIVAVLSDQPNKAVDLGFAIKRHLFAHPTSQKQLLASTTLSVATKLSNKPKEELKNRQKNVSIDDFGLRSSSHNIKSKITNRLNKKNKSKDDFDIEYKYSEKFTNKK